MQYAITIIPMHGFVKLSLISKFKPIKKIKIISYLKKFKLIKRVVMG